MNDTKLRYKGYEFLCNPHTISLKHRRNIVEFNSPLCHSIVQDLGSTAREVAGEGTLYGADVLKQYELLQNTFLNDDEGTLYIPGLKPMQAMFCSLAVVAKPAPNLLYYTFKFLEVM